MFTQFFKTSYRFGDFGSTRFQLSTADVASHGHSDVVYPIGSSTEYYYNKKVPFWPASSNDIDLFQAATSSNNGGWSARDDTYVDGLPFNATFIKLTYNAWHFNGDDVVMTMTASNPTSNQILIKSLVFVSWNPVFSSDTGTSNTNIYTPVIYHNLATPIEIPANDSVLIDVTYSAGDVSDVSAG